MGAERLDAFLAHRGFGTRTEVRHRLRRGDVTVDGEPCRDGARRITTEAVAVGGVPVVTGSASATVVMHKPVGYACSHDPREAPLVSELIPASLAHLPLETAGRLDRETSGLLVLTTEGTLIHALTHPRKHVRKRYRVVYEGTLPTDAEARCAEGMMLRGETEPTLPAILEREGEGVATLHLSEGRFHQVRRMFGALGCEVTRLHRDRVGEYELPADLPAGETRALTTADVGALQGRRPSPGPPGHPPPEGEE